MLDKEAKSYNALNIATDSDYKKLKTLFDQLGSWQKAWRSYNREHNLNLNPDLEWSKLKKFNIKLLLNADPNFPELLREMPWPPFGIYVRGKLPQNYLGVSIVGTRKATENGLRLSQDFSKQLSISGLTIVSGLALGIDEYAHRGAVEAGARTIAVLSLGLDRVYPRQNENLAKKILKCGGCLISEYPIGADAYPARFIERNRIISGLSKATIIIEAPEKSGALATARFAIDQNREIFVVPGAVTSPNYAGSNKLIRSGARIVASPKDVLEDLGIDVEEKSAQNEAPVANLNDIQQKIFNTLKESGEPISVDKLSELSKIDISELTRQLTFLTLEGIVKENGGRYHL